MFTIFSRLAQAEKRTKTKGFWSSCNLYFLVKCKAREIAEETGQRGRGGSLCDIKSTWHLSHLSLFLVFQMDNVDVSDLEASQNFIAVFQGAGAGAAN